MLSSKMRRQAHGRQGFRWRRNVATFATVAILVTALLWLATPIIVESNNVSWSTLSDVGQAYGAIFSGLALFGILVSLFIQRRQSQTITAHALRERHFDLLKLMLDQPELMYGFGLDPANPDAKRSVYVNLIVGHMHMAWMLGEAHEPDLRLAVREMFRGSAARDFWRRAGRRWTTDRQPRAQQFMMLVQEEYESAVAAGPPAVTPNESLAHRKTEQPSHVDEGVDQCASGSTLGAAGIGIAAGFTLGVLVRSRRANSL